MLDGEKLKVIMKEKGVTQTELAKRLGIDRSHLSKVVNGTTSPSFALMARIADELNVSLRDFF
ncbi:helix-turn-helix domain-containing protein [Fictibacillus macauensis ZFHKF-1]|uniref:Helix-turn-helix domain-containing protein n=1 Tax=Fictibacillus macauensis ZFHKF-1 TaxID=1196324 RepID=I8J2K3_9BACL|nr:helix-turn-helix transcriptional regulator [Fictibacillus macauensis]EIT85956.1 helix-turn-helix domain-containing protein [Fictibacillus macauensis ZFHKF-1]